MPIVVRAVGLTRKEGKRKGSGEDKPRVNIDFGEGD